MKKKRIRNYYKLKEFFNRTEDILALASNVCVGSCTITMKFFLHENPERLLNILLFVAEILGLELSRFSSDSEVFVTIS